MKAAQIKIELTMDVEVDDSTSLDEATKIALFTCEAETSIKTSVLDKLHGSDVINCEVLDAEFID